MTPRTALQAVESAGAIPEQRGTDKDHRPVECRIELVPDGPALVRGADVIRDADGEAHEVTRPVVAVCVCGLSQRAPFCDATHKVAQKRRRK